LELNTVEVSAAAPSVVDVRSGDQTFQASQYHGAPTTTTSQILQQSISGAARAPTGEVHIRGQHAEYTYYVDGVPVSSGVSGSLNELFDPAIISHIDFKTGGWDWNAKQERGGRGRRDPHPDWSVSRQSRVTAAVQRQRPGVRREPERLNRRVRFRLAAGHRHAPRTGARRSRDG
jgi:hypothetical protein